MKDVNWVKVWDPLVRFFHWGLAAGFLTAYFTEDELQPIHVWAGYIVLGLVLLRVVWGFTGTTHARFTDFIYSPDKVLLYLKDVFACRAPRYIGHNPAGGAMIVLLLICLLLTTVSGMAYYGADAWQGPLAGLMRQTDEFWIEILEETHEIAANFTLFLVIVHVLGVVWESLLHKENLVYAMINGRKRA